MSRRASGLSELISASSALVLWALHFSLIYMVTAVACARGLSTHRLAGLPTLPLLIMGASALALLAMLLVALRAWGEWKASPRPGAHRFLSLFALSTTPIAALGVVWATIPVLLVEPCA